MRPLQVSVLALAPTLPLQTGQLHIVTDSLIGVAVGIVVVGLYLVVLRWRTEDGSGGAGPSSNGRDRQSNE